MNKTQTLLNEHFPTYVAAIKRNHQDQRGVVLITVLLTGLLLTFVGLSLADVAISQLRRTNNNVFVSNALLTAEAGIEQSLHELNIDGNFSGFADEMSFFEEDKQGRGTYQTSISTGSGNEKILTSVGRVYNDNGEIASERRVRVSLVGTASSMPSVIAGAGGLKLGGSARINNSDVHVNGFISLAGASGIGSDSNPVNVSVANYNCPTGSNPGPSYPSLCATGQPIMIGDWQSTTILGTVCATGQTQAKFPDSPWNSNPPQIRPGASGGDGLLPGCVAPYGNLPTYDKAEHISRITTTANANDINFDCSAWQNPIGRVRTWPSNLQLNGNVNAGSSCDLTITGDVYITGNLTIGGGATIRIADSLGDRVPVIVVNGTIEAGSGATILPNASGTSAKFISFVSHNNCDPSCTGTNLKRSQDIIGVNVSGGGQFAGVAFQAYWSTIRIGGSGLIGSAVGQIIDMNGAGNITYGTTLSSGTTTWTIRSYQYDYN